MNNYIIGAMIVAMFYGSMAFAQTPTPTITLRPGDKVAKWLGDYPVPLPKEGLVPDKETAIQIAEVVLFRLYGKENIIHQRPYVVKEEDYVWWISGTLKNNELGRTFSIAISRQTAAVLHLMP